MSDYLVRNLKDGPRDYVLKDGSSIYLKPKGKKTNIVRVDEDNLSEVLKLAERKKLVKLEVVV